MENICFLDSGEFILSSFDAKEVDKGTTVYVFDMSENVWWKGTVVDKADDLPKTSGDLVGIFGIFGNGGVMIAVKKKKKVLCPPNHKADYTRFAKELKKQWEPADKYLITYFGTEDTIEDECGGDTLDEVVCGCYTGALRHFGLDIACVASVRITPQE